MKNLILLNATIIFFAILSILCQHTGFHNFYIVLKPLTTILILLLPIIFSKRKGEKFYTFLVGGLVFCLIGDAFLLDRDFLLFGLLSFLVGHVLFAMGFMSQKGMSKSMLPLLLLLIYGSFMYWRLYPSLEDMRIPVLLYILVILFMAWQGFNLYLGHRTRSTLYIAFGVSLFVISDTLLSIDLFLKPFAWSGIAVLSSYWASLLLIANASLIEDDQN